MSALSSPDAIFFGTILESLFYGLYCVIFFFYLLIHTSKNRADRNLLIYPLPSLFFLCTVHLAIDIAKQYLTIHMHGHPLLWRLSITNYALYSFIDFIAQGVLIYRCWVVWCHRLLVVIVPSISALVSLAALLASVAELYLLEESNQLNTAYWFTPIGILCFSSSLVVNAILTGLLVFKINRAPVASVVRSRRRNGHRLVSMLIESGVVLFFAQLVWVICFGLDHNVFFLVGGAITMIYGIVPTFIVVWVAMGDTYNNHTSSEESALRSLIRT